MAGRLTWEAPKRPVNVLQVLEEDEPGAPPTPQRLIVSGGLTGFSVAQDLLRLDFSPPEEAPREFRARPYDMQTVTSAKSGVSVSGPSLAWQEVWDCAGMHVAWSPRLVKGACRSLGHARSQVNPKSMGTWRPGMQQRLCRIVGRRCGLMAVQAALARWTRRHACCRSTWRGCGSRRTRSET